MCHCAIICGCTNVLLCQCATLHTATLASWENSRVVTPLLNLWRSLEQIWNKRFTSECTLQQNDTN